jgi:hypothetical protein
MNVVAITPTGHRPEGMALLAEYLNAQTYDGPMLWVIVDDCDPVTRVPRVRDGIRTALVRPRWRWSAGSNTQAASMVEGLRMATEKHRVLVLEDDDVYLPDHIENTLSALNSADLVGERESRYYNVSSRRYRTLPGSYHASMCSVGLKGEAVDHLRQICRSNKTRLDMLLWKTFRGTSRLLDTNNVVGIKGMPGRSGIGVGHRSNFGKPDPHGMKLQEWIGRYANNYSVFREAA